MDLKRIMVKCSGVLNCIALLAVIQSANNTCVWIVHQPQFPDTAYKYKKIK
ncbi:MAG: cyclic lactone autoinducer peptide [Lachnospiraceae bacterium]|nr:cyclic lactone autoinducer peptide [Lachnospiraceae bacterium]